MDISLVGLGMDIGRLVDFDNIKIRSCSVQLFTSPLVELTDHSQVVAICAWVCQMCVYLIKNHLKYFLLKSYMIVEIK